MTYPITPNPSIHQQPKNIGGQNMVFTGGQLQQWAQQLPLAMTLQLMDAILKALGVSQSTIDSFNNQETAYYNAVQTELGTVNTDVAALQADSSASTAAFSTFITSVESAISGYTTWSAFITAIESAWQTYSTTESGLTSSAIFTLQQLFNTIFGLNSTTGLISGSNISSSTGLATLQADWNAWVSNIEAGWNSLWGVTTVPTTSSLVQSTSVASSLGNSSLSTDVTSVHSTASAASAAATTAGTNASLAVAQGQAITDGIYQASNGGSSTGNPTSTVVTSLTNIPASNVVGLASASVAFGNSASNFGAASGFTASYTPASSDTYAAIVVGWYSTSNGAGAPTMTWAGTAMTKLTHIVSSANYGGNYVHADVWFIKFSAGAYSGGASVVYSNSSASGFDYGIESFSAQKVNSDVFTGAGITSSAAMTMSFTSTAGSPTANELLAFYVAIGSSKATFSGWTPGTAPINNGPTGAQGGVGLYMGYASGSASTVNFSANHGIIAGPSGQWIGGVLELSN